MLQLVCERGAAALTRGNEDRVVARDRAGDVREVRGAGLLLGAELDRSAADVVAACTERGLLVGTAGANVVRLTPPLIVTTAELEDALGVLEEVLA